MEKELKDVLDEFGKITIKGIEAGLKKQECATKNKKVNILGTDYTICFQKETENDRLKTMDGYCDKTVKKIVVADLEQEPDSCEDLDAYTKTVLRHELVHAYLYESGLAENMEHKPYGHEETMVDWLAIQSPKIFKTFEELGCL